MKKKISLIFSFIFLFVVGITGVKADSLKVGDYVQFTPSKTTYSVSNSVTGHATDQTIKPSELKLWRVIKVNSNGTFDAISEYVSSNTVMFEGKTGYRHLVSTLQSAARAYENSNYTTGSRMVGFDGQTEDLEDFDFSRGIDTATLGLPTSGQGTESYECQTLTGTSVCVPYYEGVRGDTLYLNDYALVGQVYGNRKAYKVNDTSTAAGYWLASRAFVYGTDQALSSYQKAYFSGHYINDSGSLLEAPYMLYYDYSTQGVTNGQAYYNLRPIVVLKSNVRWNTGSGTKSNPYVLTTETATTCPTISASDVTMNIGDTLNYRNRIGNSSYGITIDDTSIATIDSNGVITAKKEGLTYIIIDPKVSNCTPLNVKLTVSVDPGTPIQEDKNDDLDLKENQVIDLSNKVDDASKYTWKSSNTSVATVDKNGKVTILKQGVVTISAENGSKKFSTTITVYKEIKSTTTEKSVTLLTNNDALESNVTLKVEKVQESADIFGKVKSKIERYSKMVLYDITILKGTEKVQPNGEVIVEFDVPTGYDKTKIAVYRVESDESLTRLEAKIVNGKIQVKTNHFSNYAVVQLTDKSGIEEINVAPTSKKTIETCENPRTGNYVSYVVGIIVIALAGTGLVVLKNKKILNK